MVLKSQNSTNVAFQSYGRYVKAAATDFAIYVYHNITLHNINHNITPNITFVYVLCLN